MSVGPVRPGSFGAEPPSLERKAPSPVKSPSPEVEHTPVETPRAQNSPIATLPPEHEVQVRDDSSTNNVLVYRTVDKQSGDLVAQVPSADQLKELQQTQEVLKQAAARQKADVPPPAPTPAAASSTNVKQEGKTNGS